ncbi:MAG: hypothetical protein M3467_02250, partial [Actinomycetota bacterium]|nr:hypothetical protein [Actinomycetota bacterium]
QVTSPGSPPLIFDDPFVTFDDDRARRAIQLLSDAAVDHQIIFLTISDRYDDLAQKVVVLSPPAAANEAASAAAASERIPVAAQSSHSPE